MSPFAMGVLFGAVSAILHMGIVLALIAIHRETEI